MRFFFRYSVARAQIAIIISLALLVFLQSDAGKAGFGIFQVNKVGAGAACTTNGSDGFAGAPIATVQYPTLLSGLMTTPSWCVPGVGYAVGYPAATVLKDPLTITHCSAPLTPNPCQRVDIMTVEVGAGVTLDGYDFSLSGGWVVDIEDTPVTIKNSNFLTGSHNLAPITESAAGCDVTLTNNVIDAAGLNGSSTGSPINLTGGTGTCTVIIEYNWIKNAFADHIDIYFQGTSNTDIIKYNVMENNGIGGVSAHGDIMAFCGAQASITVDYNLYLFSDSNVVTNGIGFGHSSNCSATLGAITVNNSVYIVQAGSGTPGDFIASSGFSPPTAGKSDVNSLAINNNYWAPGSTPSFYTCNVGTTGTDSGNGAISYTGNLNMNTGAAAIANGSTTC